MSSWPISWTLYLSSDQCRGQTKPFSTTTEAESYLRLAQASGLIPVETAKSFVHARATTENYALDSHQNLLFSIARFREFTGHFPSKITVIGYEFKRARFTELHREAMRWPAGKFTYIGVDPDHDGSTNAVEGEVRIYILSVWSDSWNAPITYSGKTDIRHTPLTAMAVIPSSSANADKEIPSPGSTPTTHPAQKWAPYLSGVQVTQKEEKLYFSTDFFLGVLPG